MDRPRPANRRSRVPASLVGAALLLVALLAVVAVRSPPWRRGGGVRPDEAPTDAAERWRPASPGAARSGTARLEDAPSSSAGWEEAADAVVGDLRRLLEGNARPGAFAEAQAEAARQDLARYPPERARVRAMLLGDERDRAWALAAAAALPDVDDDLAGLALRLQRPEDDELIRLLGAELVDALPPELLARHEEELLRAFEGESNPLVLAVALPALERLEAPRLRSLVESQLELASPGMLPILVGVARDRLSPAELASIGILVDDGSQTNR